MILYSFVASYVFPFAYSAPEGTPPVTARASYCIRNARACRKQ